MALTAFDHLKSMYENELFSNVISLANLLLTASDNNPDLMCPTLKFQTYMYYGESLFNCFMYRKAEKTYRLGLQYKKTCVKLKTNAKPNETVVRTLMSDSDIKYKLHLCYIKLLQNDEAIDILQSIPAKQRDVKVNMALANLLHQSGGKDRAAISAYKEVIKECPMAISAIEGLLNLGVSGIEVESMILDSILGMEWFSGWVKAQAAFHSKDYPLAISLFKEIEERGPLRNNSTVLINLGESYYFIGDSRNAKSTLQRARIADPNMRQGLAILSALLAKEKRFYELEKLIPPFWIPEEINSEGWVALSYYLYITANLARAAYLVQKACFMDKKNVEAFVLKGKILYDMKKYQEAVTHFREAYQIAPHRFEPHRGIVFCYLAMHRVREAISMANGAYKLLGNTPRVLTLYASVLMKDPTSSYKAKSLLEKALALDETYIPAAYLMGEILEEESSLEASAAFLEKQVILTPTCRLHQTLGEIYTRLRDETKAFEQFHYALNIDPHNRRALDLMQRLHASSVITPAGSNTPRTESFCCNSMSDVDVPESPYDANPDPLHDSDHEIGSELLVD